MATLRAATTASAAPRALGLDSAAAVVVGGIIGVGIFLTPGEMALALGSPFWILVVWLGVGLTVFCGALCYGELAARFPEAGGGYVYLREAWGRGVAFLYGWKSLLVMDPGLTAALAAGLATYAAVLVPLGDTGQKAVAITAILVLAILCALGVRIAAVVIRALTVVKLLLLGTIIVWGLASARGAWSNFQPFFEPRQGSAPLLAGMAGAIVAAFFSFGGFWDIAKIGDQIKDPKRTLPRALALGVGIATVVYILTSAAFIRLVPIEASGSGPAFAAQAGSALFGAEGGRVFAAIVLIAIAGSLAAVLMTAPRVYVAMARDGLFPAAVGRLHPRLGTPVRAIAIQAGLACVIVSLAGFDAILSYFVFVTVAFVALTVVGMFRLPRPNADGFRIPGHPVTPVAFLLLLATILALMGAGRPLQAALGVVVVAMGIPVYLFLIVPRARRSRRRHGVDQDDSVSPGRRGARGRARGPARALSRGVRAGFLGRRLEEHRRDAHADPRGAASRLRDLRRADVARPPADAEPARDDRDRGLGDQPLPLLTDLTRRVSASRDDGPGDGGSAHEGLPHGSDLGAGPPDARVRRDLDEGRDARREGRPRGAARRRIRRQGNTANHAHRGVVQLHQPRRGRPGRRAGLTHERLTMNCTWKWMVIGVALAGALAGGPARAQAANATLKGVVLDDSDVPIAGAVVSVGVPPQTTTTGEDGSFVLAVPPGSYDVHVSAPGYWGPTPSVDLVEGGARQLDVVLHSRLTEVVTVTATKRGETVSDVPFSMEAHTGEDLFNRGAETIEDIAANVGSFSVQSLGPGQSQVSMRGVSAGQIARDQPGVKEQVGIYLDESPISMSLFTPDLDLVDMNRVEVLRGPQGTLFGAGSATGTVRYITNQPKLGSSEGFVDFGGAFVDDGSGTGDIRVGGNVPFGEKAAGRFVGYYTRLPGFVDAVQPDLSTDDDVNDGFRGGARASVLIAPNEKLSITPRVVVQRVERNGWNLQDEHNILANPFTTTRPAVDLGDRDEFTQLDESFKDDFTLADLTLSYDFGPVTLTSVTSYTDREIRIVRDTTALTASFTGATAGFPEPIYTLDSPLFDDTDYRSWTQELRLSGENDRVDWLAGAFVMKAERDYGQDVTIPGFSAATGIPTQGASAPVDSIYFSEFEYDLDQWALFGEATFRFTDLFSLTTGLRYYDYDEDKKQEVDGFFAGNPNFPLDVLSIPGSVGAHGFAPRIIGTFHFAEDQSLSLLASKGFRLGGINDPLNVPLCSPEDFATFGGHDEWEDEKVWNYEIAYKSGNLPGNSSVNVALFQMDIDDLQTTVTAGTCSSRLVFNVPEARSRGVELEYKVAPTPNFEVSFSGSLNDGQLRSTVTSTDAMGNTSVVSGIEKGRRLPSVPEAQAALSVYYQSMVGANSQMYFTGTWQYVGSRYTQVGDQDLGEVHMTDPPLFNTIGGPLTQDVFFYDPKLPAYDILNLRVGWRHGDWDLSVYANNVLNELAYLSLDRERGTLARVGYLVNQPRTVGIKARFSF
jgi:iron complex outermembrane receptor protein